MDEVARLTGELSRLARALLATPTWSLSVRARADALVAVDRAGRVVEAARLSMIRSLDGQDVTCTGAVNLAGLLRTACLAAPGQARSDIAAARAADPDGANAGDTGAGTARGERGALAGMGAALADGVVSRAHLDVAVRTLDKIPHRMRAAAAAGVDDFLLDMSITHPPQQCEKLATQLLDQLDPDRTDRCFDPDAFTRRRLDLVVDSTGMLVIRGQLDPATGAQLKAAVDYYAAPDPAVLGQDGLPIGVDDRSPSQRRADALGIIATRGLANAGTRGGEPPRVVVHTSAEQIAALTAGSHAGRTAAGRAWCEQTGFLHPSVLARLGCGAVFERVLLAPNGAILNLGRSARLATAAQRRALAARDHGCIIPGCDRPPNQTDAHHVGGWAHGALTNIDELVLLCGPHHNAVHAGTYQIVMINGIPWVKNTTWADPDQPLVRNTLHHDTTTARRAGRQIRLDLGLDPPDTG